MQANDPEFRINRAVVQPSAAPVGAGSLPAAAGHDVALPISEASHSSTRAEAMATRKIKRTFRQVQLRSLLRVTGVFSLSLAGVWILAALALFLVAEGAGIVENLEALMRQIGWPQFEMTAWTVLRGALLSGLVFAAVSTALTLLSAFLYNLISDLVGGVQVSIVDEEAS